MEGIINHHKKQKLNKKNKYAVCYFINNGSIDFVKIADIFSCPLFFIKVDNFYKLWIVCDRILPLIFFIYLDCIPFYTENPVNFCYIDMYMNGNKEKYFSIGVVKKITFFDYVSVRNEIEKYEIKKQLGYTLRKI